MFSNGSNDAKRAGVKRVQFNLWIDERVARELRALAQLNHTTPARLVERETQPARARAKGEQQEAMT